jgi:hypothetical protein
MKGHAEEHIELLSPTVPKFITTKVKMIIMHHGQMVNQTDISYEMPTASDKYIYIQLPSGATGKTTTEVVPENRFHFWSI